MKRWILRARSTLDMISILSDKRYRRTYRELVLLGQLIHTENGNDILEGLVVLKDLLDGGGDRVVLLADL